MEQPVTTRTCNRCGAGYETLHTCAHPSHVATDSACVYSTPEIVTNLLWCDVCGTIRMILAETEEST